MMNNEELKHYGIKGQKWGRRRFQNKDGSLTPAGVQRYGTQSNFEAKYDADVRANLNAAKKVSDGGRELARSSKERDAERSRKQQKMADKAVEEAVRERARSMSDQELRDAVNRLNMEENYTRMMQNRERIDLGESKAAKFMDYSMKALTVASTTLSIAIAIKELKK